MRPTPAEQAVFAEALQRATPAARSEYLDAACGADTALRRQVELLLRAAELSDDFLEQPPLELIGTDSTALEADLAEKPGDKIGRYKLLEKIGEGGCGAVYVADQEEPVRRRVALKVIKLGMDTRSVVARFEAERQALAMMDHPNIAKVFDGGTTATGRPYFVMELVRGVRITHFCDETRLTTEARLRLFLQVCHAVQHAHQKGIIHRDLKPSNILVTVNDGAAVPKVIDFGIAKAIGQKLTDQTVFTQFHSFIGTPAYTSPEQAEMSSVDIDTRSDIYSLGVLLYELLTGYTPFDAEKLSSAGLDEMRRIIREEEPTRPSARRSRVFRAKSQIPNPQSEIEDDLDWIVMKCLEKDRARRYATTNGLAADIQRHLDNEPVAARPPSHAYRFRKWARRNKRLFTAAAVGTTALAMGLALSAWEFIEKSRAYRRALAAEHEQSRLRQMAEGNEQKARNEGARSEQFARFLAEMLRGVGPSVARGRDTAMLREILDKTAGRIAEDLRAQPEVQGDLYYTLGQTYADLASFAKAEEMFARALEKYRETLVAPHSKLALTLGRLAVAQVTQGKTSVGKPLAGEALRMARALGDRKVLVTTLRDQARALDPDQNIPEAVPFLREAWAIQKQLGDDPGTEGDILRQLGGCLAWGTTLPEAEKCLRAALELHRRHRGFDDPAVAYDCFDLAQILEQQRRFGEAETAIVEALAIFRPVLDQDHQTLSSCIAIHSHILIQLGKWDEAEALLTDAVAHSPNNPRYRNFLGNFFARRGRWAEAGAELQREATLSKHPNYVPLHAVVALLKAGKTNECLELWHSSWARLADTREFDVADKLAKMGLLLPLNEADLTRAGQLADYASTAPGPAWLVPWMQFVEALAELRRGRFESALDWSARCLDQSSATPPCRAGMQFVRALALTRLHRDSEAQTARAAGRKLLDAAREYTVGNYEGFWALWTMAGLLQEEADAVLAPDPLAAIP